MTILAPSLICPETSSTQAAGGEAGRWRCIVYCSILLVSGRGVISSDGQLAKTLIVKLKGKGSPYSITERRVPELSLIHI